MHLTVTPSDKQIYLEADGHVWPNRKVWKIEEPDFWSSLDPRISAIQYHTDGLKQKELKGPREDVVITDVSEVQMFVDKFNEYETVYQNQVAWDNNNVEGETEEQKIARLGPRP